MGPYSYADTSMYCKKVMYFYFFQDELDLFLCYLLTTVSILRQHSVSEIIRNSDDSTRIFPCPSTITSTLRATANSFFTIGLSDAFLSDYLTDLKLHRTKKKFIKNSPQWGLNSQPPDNQSNALPDEPSHYLVVCVNH